MHDFSKPAASPQKQVSGGHVRVEGERIRKASFQLRPGLTLTLKQGTQIRIVRVEALATRRGPAPEAQTLYTDLTPQQDKSPANPRFEGKGRPSKKDRRNARLYREPPLE